MNTSLTISSGYINTILLSNAGQRIYEEIWFDPHFNHQQFRIVWSCVMYVVFPLQLQCILKLSR